MSQSQPASGLVRRPRPSRCCTALFALALVVELGCDANRLVVGRSEPCEGCGGCVGATCEPPQPDCSGPELCNGLDDDCNDEVDEAATCPSSCAGIAVASQGFAYCVESLPHADAVQRCRTLGLELLRIDSAEENARVVEALSVSNDDGGVWIALERDSVDVWRWPDGQAVWHGDDRGAPELGVYANWAEFEPNGAAEESCAELRMPAGNTPGRWRAYACADSRWVLCE